MSQRLAMGMSATQYLDFVPSVKDPIIGYQVFCDYLEYVQREVDCPVRSTPYVVSVNPFYKLEMNDLLKRIVDDTAQSSIEPFLQKGMSLINSGPVVCITDLDMSRWADIRKQGGLKGEYACQVTELSTSIFREARKAVVTQLVVPKLADQDVNTASAGIDPAWIGVHWEEIENVLQSTEDLVDEQELLASYGLQLWEPVAHHSLDEISNFIHSQSMLLYSACIQVYAHQSMTYVESDEDLLSSELKLSIDINIGTP